MDKRDVQSAAMGAFATQNGHSGREGKRAERECPAPVLMLGKRN